MKLIVANFISKFWRSSKFWDTFLLIFLQSLKPWADVPSLFISFNTFSFTSVLLSSVCPWSVCLLISEYFVMFSVYVFITNMAAKSFFFPINRLTSSQVPAYEKRQLLQTAYWYIVVSVIKVHGQHRKSIASNLRPPHIKMLATPVLRPPLHLLRCSSL